MAQMRLEHARFPSLSDSSFGHAHERANIWFGIRTAADDADAISVRFEQPLFSEDLTITDTRPQMYQFHGGQGTQSRRWSGRSQEHFRSLTSF
ncbi:hypothetical protein WK80_30535 [Burkholderia multivorans]|nr:hypothetical protein WK80_30535 [Burkholderia multivorans]OXH88967.1 hypothetical protein CA831_15620 [Burkholderia multivorans]OXH92094.1 hypothetical protein CA830_11790 [Burkholderia multivorans]